jgi:hypothetical protein
MDKSYVACGDFFEFLESFLMEKYDVGCGMLIEFLEIFFNGER